MNKLNFIKLKSELNIDSVNQTIENNIKKNPNLKTAIFVDSNQKLAGILTLGDLRRLIKNYKGNTKIKKLINKNPVVCKMQDLNNNLNDYLKQELSKRNLKKVDDLIVLNPDRTIFKVLNHNKIINNSHYKQICVIGLGHIGLTLSIHLLKFFSSIKGYDILPSKIKKIKTNNLDFYERNLDSLLGNALNQNKIELESNFSKIKSQIYIVCIGTNITNKNLPNNKNLKKLFTSIAKKISNGDLIIMRGTLQVGVSRNLLVKILEKVSKLKCGKDFYFSYMPERIIEGIALDELMEIPQIISGYSQSCLNKANEFARKCFKNIINVNNLEEAEIIKLASNSFRDLNFAFANELTRIANVYNLSGHDLIRKANYGYERNNIKLPSVGVGGFCLPKDPYLFEKLFFKNDTKGYQLAKYSRKINEDSLEFLYKKIKNFKTTKKIKKIKILLLGVAFKGYPETVDVRNSPTLEVYNKLKSTNSVYMFDIMGKEIIKNNLLLKKHIVTDIKNFNNYQFVVCMNNNSKYRELVHNKITNNKKNNTKVILDVWKILDQDLLEGCGWKYEKI